METDVAGCMAGHVQKAQEPPSKPSTSPPCTSSTDRLIPASPGIGILENLLQDLPGQAGLSQKGEPFPVIIIARHQLPALQPVYVYRRTRFIAEPPGQATVVRMAVGEHNLGQICRSHTQGQPGLPGVLPWP